MYTWHKIAIVHDEEGTTRDISEFEYRDAENDLTYILSDSGGLDLKEKTNEITKDIAERIINMVKNAKSISFDELASEISEE